MTPLEKSIPYTTIGIQISTPAWGPIVLWQLRCHHHQCECCGQDVVHNFDYAWTKSTVPPPPDDFEPVWRALAMAALAELGCNLALPDYLPWQSLDVFRETS